MAMRKQGPRLIEQRWENPREDAQEVVYGAAVQTTDSPDYFSIRSKLIYALIMFFALLIFFTIFLFAAFGLRGTVVIIVFAVFAILCIAQNRFYMGVVFEFFPDAVRSHVPALFSYNPFTESYEMRGETLGRFRFRLRSVDRTRLHAVKAHTVFGWTFLLILLDEVRVGRFWWLSALCHPRRIMTLLLRQKDAQKALPLLKGYILFPSA